MIEQIYNDFTTKLLPKLAEGFTITKDYFMDLFGRYVKYLVMTDSFGVGFGFVLMILGIIFLFKIIKFGNKNGWDEEPIIMIIGSVFLIIIGFVIFILNGDNLFKDIYIPEIRVYEELKGFIK